ncbi:MAG: hypothetical protein U5Q03_18080 [Bacteroidota bacterium]|nr:hypothetical protein [Bacteroidota bacterium]
MTKPIHIKSISRIDASVTTYALFVSVIILIIISALFLLSYINRTTINSYHLKERFRQNCSSGINLLLADTTYQYGETYMLDLYETGIDTVEIRKSKWGLFDLLHSKAWYRD